LRVLVVYHSVTDGTRQMAAAAAQAAATVEATVDVRVLRAAEAGPQELLDAQGYLFATPENLASMAGVMKDFFDRTYYPVLERITSRPYAALICAGSDGHNTARQIERITTGWRLKAIAPALIVHTHAQTPEAIARVKVIEPEDLARCAEIGATLAAGLTAGIY
jgi:multimeric flavodoxin WrbA